MKIDLEELARAVNWRGKRADYLLVGEGAVAVVEETERAKIDDVRKLESTVEALLRGPLAAAVPGLCNPFRIVAVLHSKRGVDSMVYRELMSQTRKRGVVYRAANCQQQLERVLREHGFSESSAAPPNAD
ncbi:hypothetical protein [Thermofilum pendens]|uniref:hypothetical protein n=1 Tax=Thermofilum pendens TaxID=2269 RepID=UPI0011E55CF3|nr:hypothetical protein [Thermofilum pendens]